MLRPSMTVPYRRRKAVSVTLTELSDMASAARQVQRDLLYSSLAALAMAIPMTVILA